MQLAPLLDPQGRRVFTCGGPDAWKTGQFRDLSWSFEWTKVRMSRHMKPVLCIWRTPRNVVLGGLGINASDNGIWVIGRQGFADMLGVRAGHDFKLSGDPSQYLQIQAQAALPIMGFDKNDRNALRNVCACVIHCAEDFAQMPVTPRAIAEKAKDAPMWEVTAYNKATGQTVAEAEV
jgi:hypothetical protein